MRIALVLGSANWPDGPSPNLLRRARHGARLWREGKVDAVLGTGGVGNGAASEGAAIAAVLAAEGVPAHAIHKEEAARTTMENIAFSLPLLQMLGATEVLIVTDAPHCPRAVMTARAHGLPARAAPLPLKGASPRAQVRLALRELVALPGYRWRLWREPPHRPYVTKR
ncbi:YdcF family protein [Pseudoroseicyclus sp. CXY001]|uniref:YdcF family protein n=1 Tax=Pseudoroseicyclus sp. CXY001 TaxID=3242492 RepID=UPI0035710F9D